MVAPDGQPQAPAEGQEAEPRDSTRSDGPQARNHAVAGRLLQFVRDVELFHTPDGQAFARVPSSDHRETWDIGSRQFRVWLAGTYYAAEKRVPNALAMQDALEVLEGKAIHEGAKWDVHVRLAAHRDAIYVDLGNDSWECVEVTRTGWSIIADPPVRFRRPSTLLALPRPEPDGSLSRLFDFVNVPSEDDRALLLAWLVGALNPDGPYPILLLHGEQGSAKSTTARILAGLLDPSRAGLRSEPRSTQDLMIAANNGHLLALDNLSSLSNQMSDALCRIASGASFTARKLYSDRDEVVLDVRRPILLNGIEIPVTREDFLDRAIVLDMPPIMPWQRRAERELLRAFGTTRGGIFGALLHAVSMALRNHELIALTDLPRMADFAKWVAGAEDAIGLARGGLVKIYAANHESANELALESSAAASAIFSLVRESPWNGTCGDLVQALSQPERSNGSRAHGLPTTARAMRSALERATPALRAAGVRITYSRTGSRRLITLEYLPDESSRPSQASLGSPEGTHATDPVVDTPACTSLDTLHDTPRDTTGGRPSGPPFGPPRRTLVTVASDGPAEHSDGCLAEDPSAWRDGTSMEHRGVHLADIDTRSECDPGGRTGSDEETDRAGKSGETIPGVPRADGRDVRDGPFRSESKAIPTAEGFVRHGN